MATAGLWGMGTVVGGCGGAVAVGIVVDGVAVLVGVAVVVVAKVDEVVAMEESLLVCSIGQLQGDIAQQVCGEDGKGLERQLDHGPQMD